MNVNNYLDLTGNRAYSGLFFASGSFGVIEGDIEYIQSQEGDKLVYTAEKNGVRLKCVIEKAGDVFVRKDTLENISSSEIVVNDLSGRFCLDGNDYDVYTQFSGWQHESAGRWHRLVTGIFAFSGGIRTCDGAAPIMGFHNRYTGKNTVFHLIPNAKWQMSARKYPTTSKERVVVELGFSNTALRLAVKAGEVINLPEVVFFAAESKRDLDAYKLHNYFNAKYPRKSMPILYNSWLYCFDFLDIDNLKAQASAAKRVGVEAFMVDAGWFGFGKDWYTSVGDWVENTESGPRGRLAELSKHVRELGMVFGLWFEPERASATSNAVKKHPEYFIHAGEDCFLDFSNRQAVDYIFNTVSKRIEEYQVGWVKFDFNNTIPTDYTGSAFYHYLKGQREFCERLRAKFPDIYITNCAGGGYRMELYQAQFTDSYWFTDNQGPAGSLEIIKNTLLRMPTSLLERWCAQKLVNGLPRYTYKEGVKALLNCNNATWESAVLVDTSFAEGFMVGGPMGFSSDFESFDNEQLTRWQSVVTAYKAERDFYRTANARILVDTDSVTVIQYADKELKKCVIQIFAAVTQANELTVYPVVDSSLFYRIGEEVKSGAELLEDGMRVALNKDNTVQTFVFEV